MSTWLLAALFGVCFGGLAWTLLSALREAMDNYTEVYAEDTARQLDDIFLFIPPGQVLRVARIAAIGVFIAFFFLFGGFSTGREMAAGVVCGAIGGGTALRMPKFLLALLKQRRQRRFNDQLVDALTRMSNSLRAGFSIPQAIESIVQEGQNPISQEFGVFLHQTRVGVRFEDALGELEQRVGSEDLTLTVRAIEVARLTGGNLTDVFEKIAATIRERMRIEGRVRSLTAQGRLQGLVVGAMPILLLMVMSVIDPRMVGSFVSSVPGIALLCFVVLLEIAGALLIRKIVRIQV